MAASGTVCFEVLASAQAALAEILGPENVGRGLPEATAEAVLAKLTDLFVQLVRETAAETAGQPGARRTGPGAASAATGVPRANFGAQPEPDNRDLPEPEESHLEANPTGEVQVQVVTVTAGNKAATWTGSLRPETGRAAWEGELQAHAKVFGKMNADAPGSDQLAVAAGSIVAEHHQSPPVDQSAEASPEAREYAEIHRLTVAAVARVLHDGGNARASLSPQRRRQLATNLSDRLSRDLGTRARRSAAPIGAGRDRHGNYTPSGSAGAGPSGTTRIPATAPDQATSSRTGAQPGTVRHRDTNSSDEERGGDGRRIRPRLSGPPESEQGHPAPAAGLPDPSRETAGLVDSLRRDTRPIPPRQQVVPGLGPDLFGSRKAPPAPDFLRGVHQDEFAPDQVVPFFRGISMTNETRPAVGALRPNTLRNEPETITTAEFRGPNNNDPLQPKTKWSRVPKLAVAIWLGGPPDLRRPEWRGLEGIRRSLGSGVAMVLLTDVPRARVEAARRAGGAGGHGPAVQPSDRDGAERARRLALTGRLLDWAVDQGVLLVNVDEISYKDQELALDDAYRAELARRTGYGYARASDILRFSFAERFGTLLYTDWDNAVKPEFRDAPAGTLLNSLEQLFRQRGYAVEIEDDGKTGNAAFTAGFGHPFPKAVLRQIKARYTKTQRELYRGVGLPHELVPESPDKDEKLVRQWVTLPEPGDPDRRQFRQSILLRTGPAATLSVTSNASPTLTQLSVGYANSWAGGSPLRAERTYLPEEVPEVIRDVVATLVRDLYNREGDLHLTMAAPVIVGLPDPGFGWRAVTDYILSHPDLRSLVTMVTDRETWSGNERHTQTVVLPLPGEVRAALRLPDVPNPQGGWIRGELARPTDISGARQAQHGENPVPSRAAPHPDAREAATALLVRQGFLEVVPGESVDSGENAAFIDEVAWALEEGGIPAGLAAAHEGARKRRRLGQVVRVQMMHSAPGPGDLQKQALLGKLAELEPGSAEYERVEAVLATWDPAPGPAMAGVPATGSVSGPSHPGRSRLPGWMSRPNAVTPQRAQAITDAWLSSSRLNIGRRSAGVVAIDNALREWTRALGVAPGDVAADEAGRRAVEDAVARWKAGKTASGRMEAADALLRSLDDEAGYAATEDLLRDLHASVRETGARGAHPGPLGPDLFGLRRPATVPAFLRAGGTPSGAPFDYSRISADELVHFLRLLDMLRTPAAAEMNPRRWNVPSGRYSLSSQRDSRQWAPRPDAEPLPSGTVEVPMLVQAAWFGATLRPTGPSAGAWARFREGAESFGHQATFVLFTDRPREALAAVRDLDDRPELEPGRSDWQLARWARDAGIRLVNLFEVIPAFGDSPLLPLIQTELAKQTPRGYAAASDNARVFLHRFGGLYTDPDNDIVSLDSLTRIGNGETQETFAVAKANVGSITNSAMALTRNHPIVNLEQRALAEHYRSTQPKLINDLSRRYPTAERRYSVLFRSGSAIFRAIEDAGYTTDNVPILPGVADVADKSWLAPHPDDGTAHRWTKRDTLEFTQKVIHSMVRSLYNRDGDLHLTHINDAVKTHGDPGLVWQAAFAFLSAREDLRTLLRSVTYSDPHYKKADEDGIWRLIRRLLPPQAVDLLQPSPDTLSLAGRDGRWLGEQPLGARLLANPARQDRVTAGRSGGQPGVQRLRGGASGLRDMLSALAAGQRRLGQAGHRRRSSPAEGDIIGDWEGISGVGMKPRSSRLKEIDAAVSAAAARPTEAALLWRVLDAIESWRDSKTGVSIRDGAVARLQARVKQELSVLEPGTVGGRAMPVAKPPRAGMKPRQVGREKYVATQRMVPSAQDLKVARALRSGEPVGRVDEMRAELDRVRGLARPAGLVSGGALGQQAQRIEEDVQVMTGMLARSATVWRRLREPQVAALVVVERRGREIEGRAFEAARDLLRTREWARRYAGLDAGELLASVHQHLRSGTRLITNMWRQGLEGFLSDPEGRYRNVWEIGARAVDGQAAGEGNWRALAEDVYGYAATTGGWRKKLPVPGSQEARDLPKYGSLIGRHQPEGVPAYGPVVIAWRAAVRARATFIPGDTAQGYTASMVTGPDNLYPLLAWGDDDSVRVAFAEATGSAYDPGFPAEWRARNLTHFLPFAGYFEAQIHGDLSWSDVEQVSLWYRGDDELPEVERLRSRILEVARERSLDLRIEVREHMHFERPRRESLAETGSVYSQDQVTDVWLTRTDHPMWRGLEASAADPRLSQRARQKLEAARTTYGETPGSGPGRPRDDNEAGEERGPRGTGGLQAEPLDVVARQAGTSGSAPDRDPGPRAAAIAEVLRFSADGTGRRVNLPDHATEDQLDAIGRRGGLASLDAVEELAARIADAFTDPADGADGADGPPADVALTLTIPAGRTPDSITSGGQIVQAVATKLKHPVFMHLEETGVEFKICW